MTITVEGPGGATVEFPDGTSTETINQAMTQHFGGSSPKEPSGVAAGLSKGTADLGNDLASTAKTYLGVGDGPKPEDPNYVAANVTNGSLNPLNWNYSQLPQKAAELAPGLAEQLAAAKAGAMAGKSIGGVKGAALGAMLASGATLWANSAGRAAKADAVDRTGDANAEPNTADKTRAGLTSAASAAVQSVFPTRWATAGPIKTVGTSGVLDAVKKYLATTGVAGVAGGAGSVVDQAGNTVGTDKGLRVDPGQVGDAALGNMAVAGTLGAPRLAAESANATRQRVFGGDNKDASAAYFKRLQDNAGSDGLGKSAGDFAAQENTKNNLKRELQAVDDNGMSPDTANTLALARSGAPLTEDHVKDIEASDPAAGHLARQMYVAQQAEKFGSYDRSNKQWAGGISGFADKYAVRPFKAHMLIGGGSALIGAHMLGSYSLPVLGGAAGAYAGTRMVDNITGMRSPANALATKFADDNVPTRLPPVTAPPPPPPAPTSPWGPRPLPQQSVPQVTPGAAQAAQSSTDAQAQSDANWKVMRQQAESENSDKDLLWKLTRAQADSENDAVNARNTVAAKQDNADFKVNQVQAASENKARNMMALAILKQKNADFRANQVQAESENKAQDANFRANQTQAGSENAARDALQSAALRQHVANLRAMQTQAESENKALDANHRVNVAQAFSVNRNLNKDFGANQAQAVSENRARDAQAEEAANASPAAAPAIQVNGSAAPSAILNRVNAITAPAKISKKADGEVKETHAPTEAFDWDRVGDYTPGQVENPFRGKTAHEIARTSADAMQGLPELRRLSYYNNTLGTRLARDHVIEQLKGAFPGEQSTLDELRHDIHAPGNSDQAQSMRVIKKYTSLMSPEAAQATRAAFRRADVRDAIWPPAKAKTAPKAKKTEGAAPANDEPVSGHAQPQEMQQQHQKSSGGEDKLSSSKNVKVGARVTYRSLDDSIRPERGTIKKVSGGKVHIVWDHDEDKELMDYDIHPATTIFVDK